ncbi:hypothetical protein ACA910_014107 [Epithemia clementina (nom. ined.)]
MSTSIRFRRTLFLMGIPGFLMTSLFLFIILVLLSSSSRSVSSSSSTSIASPSFLTSSASHNNLKSPHRHPFVRPAVSLQSAAPPPHGRSLLSRVLSLSDKTAPEPEPRFLVFGTSTTYGVGLERPLEEAYPYQLSAAASYAVHNAATQSGGFTMAAACTQSIVGDDTIYDVIVFEFQTWEPALSLLAARIRQRFPQALLVFLRLWHPSQLQYQQADGSMIDFQTYRRANASKKAMDDPELYLDILAHKERWSFVQSEEDEAMVLSQASRHSASYFAMNIPDKDLFEYPKTMMDQLSIFQEDSDDLNAQGHAVVASSLKSVIRAALNPKNQKHKPAVIRTALGSWGEGDECRLWYENGLYHTEKDSQRLRRVEFDKTTKDGSSGSSWFVGPDHKHALEVDNRGGSTLTITNPFNTERMLYLTYLTAPTVGAAANTNTDQAITGGDEDAGPSGVHDVNNNVNNNDDDYGVEDYAQLRVRINDKPAILIEAWHNDVVAHHQELARTTAVGMLPPGPCTVHLDPVVQVSHGTRPFRLLGWSLLPQSVVEGHLALEFSLEQSRVPVEDYWNWFSR